jgi:trehalose-6-phosphate synthase
MWTKDDLQDLVKTKLAGYLFVVVSNREPYIHTYSGNSIQCIVPASGLTVALDPVMQACGGTWVAHGSGDADREVVNERNRVKVPPDKPTYTLRRVWLTKEEESGYYLGFSNEALWPLCHIVYTRPTFDETDWTTYKRVNQLFAEAVLDEVRDRKAFVFIQDYHLALLSKLIKSKNPKITTAQFWHIPWPNPEAFRICPWQEEILDGLLGNNILGFHIGYHRNNFLETIDRVLESKIDYERHAVSRGGRTTLVRPFPISVDFDRISCDAATKEVSREIERLQHNWGLSDQFVGIGIDRIDYTKGIPERFKALDRFLSRYPKYRKKVVFFQLGEPSRIHIKRYKELNSEIDDLIEEINWKHQSGDWKPIIYVREHLSPITLLAYHRLANFCVVSSLHDGMNLVAKEFISSRIDEDGVLILSRFTGASRELDEALLINPYAIDDFAEAIRKAIEMPEDARRNSMIKLRSIVRDNNIYRWAGEIISELVKSKSE